MGLARRIAAIVFMAVSLAAALGGCGPAAPPEARLRASLDALQQAVEAREGGRVGEFIAADFIGPGAMDREGALRMARGAFLRYRNVGVSIVGPLEVTMQGDEHARVRFDAALTGGSGTLLPDSARVWSADTGWRVEDGEWRMISAEWKPRL